MRLIITIFFLIPYFVCAADFAYIKGNKANLRVGPSMDYPIEWVYTVKGMPLEILSKYETWYQVKDIEGVVGWMQQHILSKQKHAVTTKSTVIRYTDDSKSKIKAYVDRYVVAKVIKCRNDRCKIKVRDDITGWIDKNCIWGVS